MKKAKKNSNYGTAKAKPVEKSRFWKLAGLDIARFFMLVGAFFVPELFAYMLLGPEQPLILAFGLLWAVLLSAALYAIPRKVSRIMFGIVYYAAALLTVVQLGYFQIFGKLMWLTSFRFAGEGAEFLGSILENFSVYYWVGIVALLGLGVAVIWFYPPTARNHYVRVWMALPFALSIVGLSFLPEAVFLKDQDVWGTRSEFGQSSSLRATYKTMYDAKNVYDICGIYQLTFRDIWVNALYPLTPAYQAQLHAQLDEINGYFEDRGQHTDNDMTGIFAGKNVVFVLMESMDDWLITPEDTPTICQMMAEGINFTDFYTPGYGTARTLNSEFCMNTGIYLPTTGKYVFDYVTNDYRQSMAGRMVANGYSAEVFHYNTREFYSRGVFEPAMGYDGYNTYMDYTLEKNDLYSDQYLFDNETLNNLFFREGQTFNTIITRSAHGSYIYREVLSHYALKQYPDYRGKFATEEEDCARVKAKLVDDMFARLIWELEQKGQLENTVIVAATDHYTYLYKNTDELLELSGVTKENQLLMERTPCFIWSADGPSLEVDKTLNTADLLPTVLNLMGMNPGWQYLGQDAFDPDYAGYCIFPDGSWVSDGVLCKSGKILVNKKEKDCTQEYLQQMATVADNFIHVSNLLLTSDYYANCQ